jgi:hypothetical protein
LLSYTIFILGEAILAWSFNHEEEIKSELVETRDKKIGIRTNNKKKGRQSLWKEAHPQEGANYLAPKSKKIMIEISL